MNYRHAFHAGNFADVFKHIIIARILTHLREKIAPFRVIDTHAGEGLYDLAGDEASRTGEWRDGIGRLEDAGDVADAPELVAEYLRLIRLGRSQGVADHYPGSPQFARAMARAGDRMVFCEKVPEVAADLRRSLRGDPRAEVHVRDGYEAHALLPPPEKRGLMLIDPPFERTDEMDAIADLIGKSVERFAGGIYAAWYPIKNRHLVSRCVRRVARETGKPVLNLEFDNGESAGDEIRFASTERNKPERPTRTGGPTRAEALRGGPVRTTGRGGPPRHQDASPGIVRVKEKVTMHACGLLVVNAPFGFEQSASQALQWLKPRLAQGSRASFTIAHGMVEDT